MVINYCSHLPDFHVSAHRNEKMSAFSHSCSSFVENLQMSIGFLSNAKLRPSPTSKFHILLDLIIKVVYCTCFKCFDELPWEHRRGRNFFWSLQTQSGFQRSLGVHIQSPNRNITARRKANMGPSYNQHHLAQ